MIIIDNKKDLANLSLAGDVILIPIYQNYKVHLKFNNVIILYILQLSDKKEWLIVTNRHNESLSNITKIKINDFNGIKYVIDKRELLYSINNLSDVVCLSTLYFLKFNKKLNIDLTNTSLHKFYSTKYSTFKDINMVIPLYKHYELCSRLSAVLVRIIRLCDVYNPEFKFFNDIAIPAFRILEENGLKIDKSKINPQFISKLKEYNKSDYIYSNYSFNTATGRPSNTFNKINFAALNKKDGTREAIISRFKNGMLLEYDYAAYHLQLISEVINFKLPADKDFHKYMAQQYFNKSNVSTDEIKKGKSITFRLLYGGVTKEYEHIDFYKQLQPIINALWMQYCKTNKMVLPIINRLVKNLDNKYKVFNYIIQNIETKRNTTVLNRLNEYLADKSTKPILYTYDSFLIDYDISDGKDVLREITNIITDNDKYGVTFKAGINYDCMKSFTTFF